MEVTYKNSLLDIIRFNLYCIPRMKGIQLLYLFVIPILGYSVWSSVTVTNSGVVTKLIITLIILFFIVILISAFSMIFSMIGLLLSRDKHFSAVKTVSLSSDAVTQATDFGKQVTGWSGVHKVSESGKLIFLFLTHRTAHIIPKGAFDSAEKAEQFCNYANDHWKAAM